MGKEINTLFLAEAAVMRAEAKFLKDLAKKVSQPFPDQKDVDALVDEKQRISERRVFDHEEVWLATGRYTKGRL